MKFSYRICTTFLRLIKKNIPKQLHIKNNIYSFLLFLRIIDLSENILSSFNKNLYSSIIIITRSLIETMVDFENSLYIPNYSAYLDFSDIYNQYKILTDYKINPHNPFYKSFNFSDLDNTISKLKNAIDTLKKQNIHKLTIYEKFDFLKGDFIYKSVYFTLCEESHNSIAYLKTKFIDIDSDNVTFSLKSKKKISYYNFILETVMGILLSSSWEINKIFNCFTNSFLRKIKMYLL